MPIPNPWWEDYNWGGAFDNTNSANPSGSGTMNPFDPPLNTGGIVGYISPPDSSAIGARDMNHVPYGGLLTGAGGVDPTGTHSVFNPNPTTGGQGPGVFPLPVDPSTALLASILLSGGIPNPFNGGASPGQVVDRVGEIAKDPIGTTNQTVNRIGDQAGDLGGVILPVGSGGSGSPAPTGPTGGGGPNQPTDTTVVPITPGALGGVPEQQTSIFPTATPGAPAENPPSIVAPNPRTPWRGNEQPPPVTFNPITPAAPTPTPTPAPTPSPGPTFPPIIPVPVTNTTMPTGSPPPPRNYLQEGQLGAAAYNQLAPNLFGNYTTYAPQYGQSDLNSLGALYGRQGTQTLGGINSAAYGAMDGTVSGDLQAMARQQLALGSSLSSQQIRDSQQAARAGDSARGLAMGPNSVQNEVLNQDRYGQQLLQQRQNFAASVNPQLMQNAQQLQTMGTGFSSGANSNQFVQQQANPFNQYANDVYGSNFNAGYSDYLNQMDNATAQKIGQQKNTANYTNMFMNALYGIGSSKGWFG